MKLRGTDIKNVGDIVKRECPHVLAQTGVRHYIERSDIKIKTVQEFGGLTNDRKGGERDQKALWEVSKKIRDPEEATKIPL